MKIIITGGHHNSALIIAKELIKQGDKVFWFGHKYTMVGDKNVSTEYTEVIKENIPFFNLKAGKLQRNYKFLQNLLKIPLGFLQSFLYIFRLKPNIIVSFGGYLALPVAMSGFILGIPIVTHEQTSVSGIANKIISFVSKKVFISFPSSAKYFSKNKIILTGLPVRSSIFEKGKPFFSNKKRTIFIFGGKQGSHTINEAIYEILPELIKKYNVIHQCGSTSVYNDIQKGLEVKLKLGENKENYIVKEYFFNDEIGRCFGQSDFVISRAGAHTIYELILLRKPAIVIPIPWSNNNEQAENAKILKDYHIGEILSEKDLIKGKLFETILKFDENLNNYHLENQIDICNIDATSLIIKEINKFLNKE